MTSHSDQLSWKENWDYLLRCFPSLEKAPDPAKEQFHQRCANLKQRWMREAITLAMSKHAKRFLTLQQLLEFYEKVLPAEPQEQQPRQNAFIVDYWVFPKRYSENVQVFKTEQEARRVSKQHPGSRVQARWCRPGDNGWYQDLDADETLATPEQETDMLCHMYALMAKSITNRQSTYQYTYDRLSALPPSDSPPEGSTRASDASASRSGADAPSRTPDEGALSSPPYGQNKIDGMTLARHPLPAHLIEQIERAYAALGSSDGAPPHEAGIACVEPDGGEA